ncbi:MAG: TonB-dependent receptor [Acidiferrobacterales bacterium]|nr:TonB-dependent receptor [Acidiferrobacterales bacterium]
MKFSFSSITAVSLLTVFTSFSTQAQSLEEIVVTAELLEANVLELPNSITIINNATIEQRGAQHLEDLFNLAPNVNFATGASRGRFIQIRGIGERSEFVEPINNSVGVTVDGIDMTGIATGVTTLDVQQVEVLRGPQGTLYGANALAGLINVVSNRPTDAFFGKLSGGFQDFGGLEYGAVVSGPTSESSGYRLAINHYESDGFTEDVFLGREDTNNIDETSARGRYISQVNDALNLDFTVLVADINNGYDAFSLDNTRQTYSDQPGADTQDTIAGSIRAAYDINPSLTFEGLLSLAKSELEYSYDEDWANDGICDNSACDSSLFGFDWFYSSVDQYLRDNDNTTLDLRLVSQNQGPLSWVVGAYHRDQSIDLLRVYTFADGDFRSALDTTNTALYGQVDYAFSEQWSATVGLRSEQRDLDYIDSDGANASPNESLWGGRIAVEYHANSGAFYYGLISRGYKPGGFNLDGSISAENREFDTETMINYEIGVKNSLFDDRLQLQAALFYQDRKDIQTKSSIVASIETGEIGGLCPCSFTDFTDNATSGTNSGIEVEINFLASDKLNVYASLGLLNTEFDNYLSFEHINANLDNGVAFNLAGREQAHAPGYMAVVGGSYAFTKSIELSGSIETKDAFFLSNRHEEQTDAYQLVNLELAYNLESWRIALYGKNLTDETVITRGFGSFGNDPRKFYETEPYYQYGAPRVIGLKASMEF